ncbi:MAG TPA: DNA mismatch repair protein MutS [Thermoanaerobaculia bacterium]|nr:DNA mismatch repair protein MutS [Thermoanaerobaculia bacterium]
MSAETSRAPVNVYQERAAAFTEEERRRSRVSFRFSLLRGGLFFAFAGCLLMILITAGTFVPGWWIGAGAALLGFLAVLPVHDRVIAAEHRARDLRQINEEGGRRLARDWDGLPLPTFSGPGVEDREDLPLARDLNLFGRASLSHLLGTAHTPPGKATLAGWLVHPAPPEEIVRRQEAVAELAPALELRQQLQVRARPMDRVPPNVEPFLRWAEDEPWLLGRPWLVWLARALAVLTLGLVVAAIATPLPSWPALLMITVNLLLSYGLQGRLEAVFTRVSAREGEFLLYAEALRVIDEAPVQAAALRQIHEELEPRGMPAHRWLDLLHRRVTLADSRHSALVHTPLQLLTLWDFHVVWLLERWQRDAGPHARRWLAALGRFEALSALAGLRFDHPGWACPSVVAGEPSLTARALGHPLIADAHRVTNDVELGPPGTFLLVTGSNMSGKSTLLRSIGVNVVLAQAGGPVCAEAMRLPPVDLGTSILVEDSLADGVSFFMAELLRIRRIVAAADRSHAQGRAFLYLLDEILRGTNSYERQVAVRKVLLHLLRQGAIGAVSTHDLELAELQELQASCRPVHFREDFHRDAQGKPLMTFDYKMRPGVATTTNALKLLELVGLSDLDTR